MTAERIKMFAVRERAAKKLCLARIKSQNCNASEKEIRCIFARALLAEKFSPIKVLLFVFIINCVFYTPIMLQVLNTQNFL
ncbi:MAG: hypothetical protein KME50_02930 [Nostoc desertorum CM1-VF14]|jgi:hypothetical protein|nr:hypothetical protein [Nostoc desertorum CM1-VF14]